MTVHQAEAEIRSAQAISSYAATGARSARLAATRGTGTEAEALAAGTVSQDARVALARRVRRYARAWGVRGAAAVLGESEREVDALIELAEWDGAREWVTVAEAAQILGLTRWSVRRIAEEGQSGILAVQTAPESARTDTGTWLLLRADVMAAWVAGRGKARSTTDPDSVPGERAAEAEEAARRG